jgi:hypothetical protein
MKRGDRHKFDAGKVMWDLLPWSVVADVVRVLMYGAKKYTVDGWKKVPDARARYFAATIRHLTAWWEGERVDRESGLTHLSHAACNLLFLMWGDRGKK